MDDRNTMTFVKFDTALVESAVLLAVAGRPEETEFHRMRDAIYERDEDSRDEEFQRIHEEWFHRLDLARPVVLAVSESRHVAGLHKISVDQARRRSDLGAELYVPRERQGRKAVRIRLRLEDFLQPDQLLFVLRREILHLDDVLDPAFGYSPALPVLDRPIALGLVLKRYSLLWDISVDGRLDAKDIAPAGTRDRRWKEYLNAFPAPEAEAAHAFQRIYDGERPDHRTLLSWSLDPSQLTARAGRDAGVCPLCRFPSFHLLRTAEGLGNLERDLVRRAVPSWRPADGLCVQCADLYRAQACTRGRIRAL